MLSLKRKISYVPSELAGQISLLAFEHSAVLHLRAGQLDFEQHHGEAVGTGEWLWPHLVPRLRRLLPDGGCWFSIGHGGGWEARPWFCPQITRPPPLTVTKTLRASVATCIHCGK